jgi:branched-subunit amino acid transport protein AzlD
LDIIVAIIIIILLRFIFKKVGLSEKVSGTIILLIIIALAYWAGYFGE